MKFGLKLLFFLTVTSIYCSSQNLNTLNLKDKKIELKRVYEENSLYASDDLFVYDSCIYMLKDRNSIIIYNKITGKYKIDLKLSNIISKFSNKFNGIKQIWVNKDNLYVAFLSGIIRISRRTSELKSSWSLEENLNYYQVNVDDNSFVYYSDKVVVYDNKGKKIEELPSQENISNANYLFFNNNLFLIHSTYLESFEVKNSKVEGHSLKIGKEDGKENLFLCCFTSQYSVWMDYQKRDKLYFLERKTMKYLNSFDLKTISFIPDKKQLDIEEGIPFFKIKPVNDNEFYITNFIGGKLELYKLTLE